MQCQGINSRGQPCGKQAADGRKFCQWHGKKSTKPAGTKPKQSKPTQARPRSASAKQIYSEICKARYTGSSPLVDAVTREVYQRLFKR